MKNLILVTSILLTSVFSFGNELPKHNDTNGGIRKNLETHLKLPDYLRKKSNTGTIKVEFIINENNDIEIINISGNNDEIISYIKTQFEKINSASSSLQKNTTYYIDINLKII